MRLYIKLILLFVLPLLVACAREEWPAGEMIRFSVDGVSAELQTKGDDPIGPDKDLGLTDAEKNTFVLWGEMTQHATPPDWSAATTVFTNRKAVKADGLWNYWGTGLPERWTRTNDYRFRAVYPATADVNQGESSGAMLTVDYSMFENEERDVNDQVTKRKGNYDLMVASATVTDAATRTDAVPLKFHHACAAVRVLFQTATSNTYITNFELQNVYALGTLNYRATDSENDETTGDSSEEQKWVPMDEWTRHGARAPHVFSWAGEVTSSSLVFEVDLTTDEEQVKVSTPGTEDDTPGPIDNATVWLEYGDGNRLGMTQASTNPPIYRVKVQNFVSTWGFHFIVSNSVWGGDGTLLSLGSTYPIAKYAKDINFAYKDDFTSYWPVPESPSAPAALWNKWYFAIPQDLNIDDGLQPAVSFTYSVGQMSIPTTLPLPVVKDNKNVKWEAGKVYLYTIQIQPESTISVSVKDWESFDVSTDDLIFYDTE